MATTDATTGADVGGIAVGLIDGKGLLADPGSQVTGGDGATATFDVACNAGGDTGADSLFANVPTTGVAVDSQNIALRITP